MVIDDPPLMAMIGVTQRRIAEPGAGFSSQFTLGDDHAGAQLDLLVDNPWARLTRMSTSSHPMDLPQWEPFDRPRALRDHTRTTIDLASADSSDLIEARLTPWGRGYANATLFVPQPRFGANGAEQARRQLARMVAALPSGAIGFVCVETIFDPYEPEGKAFLDRVGLRRPPKPIEDCSWLVALTPPAYAKFFDRADLLATPAASVVEENDVIWLQLYDGDPFAYDTPAAHERLRAVFEHLHRYAQNQWIPYGVE